MADFDENRSFLMPEDWECPPEQDPRQWRIFKAQMAFWEEVRLAWLPFGTESEDHARLKRICLYLLQRAEFGSDPYRIVCMPHGREMWRAGDDLRASFVAGDWMPVWATYLRRAFETVRTMEEVGAVAAK